MTNVLNGTVAADGNRPTAAPCCGWSSITSARAAAASAGEHHDRIGLPEPAPNPAALVIGPTGVGLGRERHAVRGRHAGQPDRRPSRTRCSAFQLTAPASPSPQGGHLNSELGLAIAPNGDILTVNGGNGNMVETTPFGAQVAVRRSTVGTPPGGGGPVRPGRQARRRRRLLRRRRHEYPQPALLTPIARAPALFGSRGPAAARSWLKGG